MTIYQWKYLNNKTLDITIKQLINDAKALEKRARAMRKAAKELEKLKLSLDQDNM